MEGIDPIESARALRAREPDSSAADLVAVEAIELIRAVSADALAATPRRREVLRQEALQRFDNLVRAGEQHALGGAPERMLNSLATAFVALLPPDRVAQLPGSAAAALPPEAVLPRQLIAPARLWAALRALGVAQVLIERLLRIGVRSERDRAHLWRLFGKLRAQDDDRDHARQGVLPV